MISVVKFPAVLALLAGIVILIRPKILNYVIAVHLIVVGLIGIFG